VRGDFGQTNKPDFLNGVPELLVLRLLSREPMHGYELVIRLERLAAVPLQFPQGLIYRDLHRLEAGRLIASRRELRNGRMLNGESNLLGLVSSVIGMLLSRALLRQTMMLTYAMNGAEGMFSVSFPPWVSQSFF
jgi:hypothetical protein